MSDSKIDIGRGCTFSNLSSEESATATPCNGCNKLNTYNYLSDIPEACEGDIFEVRFKNTRKGYYKNCSDLQLEIGDIVAVEASPGHDIGIISSTGEMVAMQMKRSGFRNDGVDFKKIYRKAKPTDIIKWQEAIAMEHRTMISSRQIASSLKLNMKIGDVEYQGDKLKAIFYYIADERVDFRELIKIFAEQFRIRIEMKQIGARQEAGRIGGIGSCGRELCCSTWVSNFVSVTTNSARYQEISLNPQKLAGQCGKLKCCLNYEVDTYIDARKGLPRVSAPLETMDGSYHLMKTDIFGKEMSFSTDAHSMANIVSISIDRVKEIIALNRKGSKPNTLQAVQQEAKVAEPDFRNVVGEESITRFDNGGSSRSSSSSVERRREQNGNRRRGGDNTTERRRFESPDRQQRSSRGGADRRNSQQSARDQNSNRPNSTTEPRSGASPREGSAPTREQGGTDTPPREPRRDNGGNNRRNYGNRRRPGRSQQGSGKKDE